MSTAALILALSLTGQTSCPDGQCPTQTYRSGVFRRAQPTYAAPAPRYAAPAPVAKSWHRLDAHPGYLGYGAFTSPGYVLVEFHVREGSTDVRPGPVPDEPPVTAKSTAPCGITGCGCGCSATKACECVTEVVGAGATK